MEIKTYILIGECLIWEGPKAGKGYGQIMIDGKKEYMHRYAWRVANNYAEIPHGMVIAHKCDTPLCHNPEHLFLCTQKENLADMYAKGRGQVGDTHWSRKHPAKVSRGEKIGNSKLTSEQVAEIRKVYVRGNRWHRSGYSIYDLAKQFSVAPQTISRIIRGELWGK